MAMRNVIQTTGSADGSYTKTKILNDAAAATKQPKEKKRSLASVLTNGRSDVIPAAEANGTSATVSTSVSAARPSIANTTSGMPSKNNGEKRRKNKTIDDFKNKYKG